MKYKHLFGPVPSRRLGISLGIDLVPFKVCSFNCTYCESGATTNLTTDRKEYIPIDDVIIELDHYLTQKPELDYITFSGAGEPTLNSGIGRLIEFIKEKYPTYKLCLITNSSLLSDANLRNEISPIDLLLPSLDAVSDIIFRKLNRSNPKIKINDIIEGLIKFRQESESVMWLEIFFVPGINDSDDELQKLKEAILKINPDQIQLNTLDRPGTEKNVKPLSRKKMEEIKTFFAPLPVEIIAKFKSRTKVKSFNSNIEERILETLLRRPCTDKDLAEMLGLHLNELNKYISNLIEKNKICSEHLERGIFFRVL
ncbi:MAG: radical SAM protein [Candidatus Cloacimonas sp. 4484_143]|nr:MAG: radical SAM protein [Candidatus Cloacimonas sp. 4484_143]RLC52931.1 MAG: radical SAM protein [Candidatus Cloacimonadota bacterium]RLC53403.1 MAG: radical SAM protein [Candidatus Cloacimonadota bacterium]